VGRSIEVEGIWIHSDIIPCFNHCGYCQVGRKKIDNVDFFRLANLVDRFYIWKQQQSLADFRVGHWFGYTHNFDLAQMIEEKRLRALGGWNLDVILLGGLPDRSASEMKAWLKERMDAGFASVISSFTGYGALHDRWNGRKGDFERLMQIQRVAADVGMGLRQRIFLTNSTLPWLDELLKRLDDLPGSVVERCAYLWFYNGFSVRLERERITEETFNNLPEHIAMLLRKDWRKWRSEARWMEAVRQEEAETPQKVSLKLIVTESNIDQVELMSCEEILAELRRRTQEAYAAIPSRRELCERWGDPSNRNMYMFQEHAERKWLDAYLQSSPIQFERHLTHLAVE
jgi:hypothetical protein